MLTKATLWTGTDRPPYRGWLLVAGEHIGAVGALDLPAPPADRVLDLAGTHILPGFVDSHLHLTVSAWLPYGIDGWHWSDLGTALAAIRDAAARDPYAPWLMLRSLPNRPTKAKASRCFKMSAIGIRNRPVGVADAAAHTPMKAAASTDR